MLKFFFYSCWDPYNTTFYINRDENIRYLLFDNNKRMKYCFKFETIKKEIEKFPNVEFINLSWCSISSHNWNDIIDILNNPKLKYLWIIGNFDLISVDSMQTVKKIDKSKLEKIILFPRDWINHNHWLSIFDKEDPRIDLWKTSMVKFYNSYYPPIHDIIQRIRSREQNPYLYRF